MKHIETIKSVVLVLLITLSITLTFTIWTYIPKYDTIEQQPTDDISIADKKIIEDVIKPYKLLFNFEEGMRGTTDSEDIDHLIRELKDWEIRGLALADNHFTDEKLAALLREKNRFALLFHSEVPFQVYDKIINIEESSPSENTFDRMIVDWNEGSQAIDVHFISRERNLRFSAKAEIPDAKNFERDVLTQGRDYATYVEANPGETPFIAVKSEPLPVMRYTYYLDRNNLLKFRDALFSDPDAVRSDQLEPNKEQFRDDHALMGVDLKNKELEYVHPKARAKSGDPVNPSELLLNTIDFVNEHGGWTDEFRFTSMALGSRAVKFQLHVHGLPVYSDTSATEIEQIWGTDKIFRYRRPYYSLDLSILLEKDFETLSSGIEVVNILKDSEVIDFSTVEEIIPGYFIVPDKNPEMFMFEPSWFYLVQGKWKRFSPEPLGGEEIGLE